MAVAEPHVPSSSIRAPYHHAELVVAADTGTDIVRLPPKPQANPPLVGNGVKSQFENDIVHVQISTFSEQTHAILVSHVDYLKKLGRPIKGYILDLRDNPGGLLDQAVAVADDFLEKGAIVLVKGNGRSLEEIERFNARPGDITDGKSIVTIINGGTVGESEIVAGALQDHKRAIVIGTPSLGGGPTSLQYYTPSGRSIRAKGITPDVWVERQPTSAEEPEKDTQLQYALKLLRGELLSPKK